MSKGGLEDFIKKSQKVKMYHDAFVDLEYCMMRIEWETIKKEYETLKNESFELLSNLESLESQIELYQRELNNGEISDVRFERKVRSICEKVSKINLELDCMDSKLCGLIDHVQDFIKEEKEIAEDEPEVIDKVNHIISLFSCEKKPEEVIPAEKKVKKYCSNCGRPNKNLLNYCPSCGAELILR